jgi:hypothetical protein
LNTTSRWPKAAIVAAQEWAQWAAEIAAALRGRRDVPAAELAALLSRTLAGRGLFCDLLPHVPLTLEREVTPDAVLVLGLTVRS